MNWEIKFRDRAQGVHIGPEATRARREDNKAEIIADETEWDLLNIIQVLKHSWEWERGMVGLLLSDSL